MAFCLAIFWVPMARMMVTTELSASGMAATARATANIMASRMPMPPRKTDRPKTSTQTARMTAASLLENWSRLTCRGVLRCSVACMSAAILPSSVSIPVPVTTACARP